MRRPGRRLGGCAAGPGSVVDGQAYAMTANPGIAGLLGWLATLIEDRPRFAMGRRNGFAEVITRARPKRQSPGPHRTRLAGATRPRVTRFASAPFSRCLGLPTPGLAYGGASSGCYRVSGKAGLREPGALARTPDRRR